MNRFETMRKDAAAIFRAGLCAVEPAAAIARHCRREGDTLVVHQTRYDLARHRKIFIIGGGKACAPMASAMERLLGDDLTGGIVNVKYGHLADLNKVRICEAGHPVPDQNGRDGTLAMLELARRAGPEDLVICLISGGASALMPMPAPGLTLADKQQTSRALLSCGADIHEINTIRKHISAIKGGRLAEAVFPATLVTLILSDVVGDDLDVIGSGPTVPDAGSFADCAEIIDRYGIEKALPEAVMTHIRAGIRGKTKETPKTGDPAFSKTCDRIVGSSLEAVLAAKREAEARGYNAVVLSAMIEGDTGAAARLHTAVAREVVRSGHPAAVPACILSGGETTVTVSGNGLGGRNQEFALHAALGIDGAGNIVVLCAGTDGTDGPTDAAGALSDADTVRRARERGLDPRHSLAQNDSYRFFKALDDLVITGPTNTNVMDLRIILIS
jgi:glycerate 2-kinase